MINERNNVLQESEEMELQPEMLIGVFDGGTDSIIGLDLGFLNLKFHKVHSGAFKSYVDSFHYYYPVSPDLTTLSDFESTFFHYLLYDQPGGFHQNMYALAPIDFAKSVDEEIFQLVHTAILIMFPSDFQLTAVIHYHKERNAKYAEQGMTTWGFVSRWHLKGDHAFDSLLLQIDKTEIANVNAFLKKTFYFISNSRDFDIAINSYIEGFSQRSAKMAYLNYCIALESLVNTREGEITYKICRTGAVINSDNKEDGELIYFNMKQFYVLRSTIVHGSKVNFQAEYFFGLQSLVSRTLVELISLEVPNRKALSKFVTENGYGDKAKLKMRYSKETFNKPIINLTLKRVSKYKD